MMAWDRKVVCLVFHGIGTYAEDFDDPKKRFDRKLWNGLYAELGERLRSHVIWTPVLWSNPKLEKRQESLYAERKEWRHTHEFITAALADAAAYQYYDDTRLEGSNYEYVQGTVYSSLEQAASTLNTHGQSLDDTPVVAVCQSMGCHVFSSYAWDIQTAPERVPGAGDDPSAFHRLDTLASVFFTGCNIPILTVGIDRDTKLPLRVPKLPRFEQGQCWVNIYDPDDPLGYPLRPEFEAYYSENPSDRMRRLQAKYERDPEQEIKVIDLDLELGFLDVGLSAFTPLAHTRYWQANPVARAIARSIEQLAS